MRLLSVLPLAAVLMLTAVSCSEDNPVVSNGDFRPEGDYMVVAWNDLGMHCLNPTYDEAVILPPYNTVYAQVVRRGDPPEIVTDGLTVEFSIVNNTTSSGKRDYGQFWTYSEALFGTALPVDVGLTGTGMSGSMELSGDHFIAEGIPVTPVDDAGAWDPYQVAIITVKDSEQNLIAETRATVPVSDEIDCARCHGIDTWNDILARHDDEHGTDHMNNKPVLCASCHGSPPLGTTGAGSSGIYMSAAIHGSHATRGATCYDCHPGQETKCMRSLRHTDADGNCETCHGTMAEVASSIPGDRIPWVGEPSCADCHGDVTGVATDPTLYRNARGHGGMFCTGCHSSPHAMVPTSEAADNYQSLQYQGYNNTVKTLGSCGVCHESSRGEDDGAEDFLEKHGGMNPEQPISCSMCHKSVLADYPRWPHAYDWTDSNTP